jgi:hypothetical protein
MIIKSVIGFEMTQKFYLENGLFKRKDQTQTECRKQSLKKAEQKMQSFNKMEESSLEQERILAPRKSRNASLLIPAKQLPHLTPVIIIHKLVCEEFFSSSNHSS